MDLESPLSKPSLNLPSKIRELLKYVEKSENNNKIPLIFRLLDIPPRIGKKIYYLVEKAKKKNICKSFTFDDYAIIFLIYPEDGYNEEILVTEVKKMQSKKQLKDFHVIHWKFNTMKDTLDWVYYLLK